MYPFKHRPVQSFSANVYANRIQDSKTQDSIANDEYSKVTQTNKADKEANFEVMKL